MTSSATLQIAAVTALSMATLQLAGQTPAQSQPSAPPLTVEAIYAHATLIATPPEGVTWSPDGKHLTTIEGGELVELDPETGKAHVLVSRAKLASFAGASDSEEDRDHRERYKMASYLWAPDSEHLLFNANGRLWFYDLHNGTGVEIGFAGIASGDDPKFSPDGESISFVRDHALAVVDLKERRMPMMYVAPAPNPNTLIGEVDWLYLEELETHSNQFWSPDSKKIAYLEMNESEVPQYPIADWIPTHTQVEMQRYPQPGDPNPDVKVGVVGGHGGKTMWMRLPFHAGQDYIPRFGWVDAKTVWIETLSRDQKHRNIYFAESATGQSHPVLELTDDTFIDDKYDVFVGGGSIVLMQWIDGHSHLYLYSYDQGKMGDTTAKLVRQLTNGDFEVGELLRVDAADKVIDYTSNEGNPRKGGEPDQQLWEVNFNGERRQLSVGAGFHEGTFPPTGSAFVDKHSSRMEEPKLKFCAEAAKCTVFWATRALEPYHLRAPEEFEVKAHDGTSLFATLLLPEGKEPASVPLIVNPYGGPGSPTMVNRWFDGLLFDELLAQHGYAVLRADNRGMGGRGRAFAQAAWHNFGAVQLEDQLSVVDAALVQYPQLDPKRLGWWGWSWGGTLTLYAMSHSERFRAGVAVAPVTDWRNYDSVYTERYMGDPAETAAIYKQFAVANSAANLKGRLLLVHGTGDDNVHMENSVQYVQKLIEAELPYDLQIYPRKTHSIAGPDVRTHLFNRILAHFEEYLKPAVVATAGQ